MCQEFPNRPQFYDERNQSNIAAAVRALEWKLLPDSGHEFRPRNPARVVGAGLYNCVAAAFRCIAGRMPTSRDFTLLADIPDGQRCDGPPELVIRGEHPVVAVPVLPRWWHQIREPYQELKRRELADAIGSRPRGLSPAARADPVGLLVPGEHVANSGRSHHKSFSDKHFEEVVVVPACGEAFVFDPGLVGCFVLEHDQSGLS